MTKRIVLSLGMIVFVAAVAVGATGAFFSDSETSTGNTFTAGSLDLKVDSQSHYNGLICRALTVQDYRWLEPVGTTGEALTTLQALDAYNTACDGTWSETDLGPTNQFFQFTDIKPGDEGENTISLHVYDNDAWGRFVISGVQDVDNSCTEPEEEAANDACTVALPENTTPGSGELAESVTFYAWIDQGAIPGFQNIDATGTPIDTNVEEGGVQLPDPTEGDNIQQCVNPTSPTSCAEPLVIPPGTVDENPNEDQSLADETHNIWSALAPAYDAYCSTFPTNGHNNYGACQGIADDGRMVGSTTYYFGLAWSVLDGVGNEAQTDSLNANLTFEVEQHRNNPTPFAP